MILFFTSIIVPITPGCENITGKRHIQFTDSAGPHCCLEYLRMLHNRGVVFCPRTPNLSHLQQNEDLCNFGKLKIEERKARQLLQNQLLQTLDGKNIATKFLNFTTQ